MDNKWYFKTSTLVIGFLCVGPIILPLVWINPNLKQKDKIIISAVILIVSYVLWILFMNSMKSMMEYYKLLLEEVQG